MFFHSKLSFFPCQEVWGQNPPPSRGLIVVAPRWFAWSMQLNGGPRPLACDNIGDNWKKFEVFLSGAIYTYLHADEMKQFFLCQMRDLQVNIMKKVNV